MEGLISFLLLLLSILGPIMPTGLTTGLSGIAQAQEVTAPGPPAVAAPAVATPTARPRVDVAIQAGHWKTEELPDALANLRGSTGASGGGRMEADLTLDIARRVARLLQADGLTVEILPATVPTGYEAGLFLSLHADGSNTASARGYKVSTRWRSNVAALDAVLVQSIEIGYAKATGMPRDPNITRAMRGYYAYSTYRGEEYRLGSETPAAILEMGFMTSPADRALMFDNPDLVARGVAAGIDSFRARRTEAERLQAAAERQAAASQFGRSVVILADGGATIRAAGSADAPKVGSGSFGESFPLNQASNPPRPPAGGWDPVQGTQSATGLGWYKVLAPGVAGDAYISRDVVVMQQ